MPPVRGPYGRNQSNNNRQLNVDQDESGIYKAKPSSYDNAKTVPDNRQMYTDLPVDYKRANEVHNVSHRQMLWVHILWFDISFSVFAKQEEIGRYQDPKPNSKIPVPNNPPYNSNNNYSPNNGYNNLNNPSTNNMNNSYSPPNSYTNNNQFNSNSVNTAANNPANNNRFNNNNSNMPYASSNVSALGGAF